MTYTADERKFWADAFLALRSASGDAWSETCAVIADKDLKAYRERFGNCSETPASSPGETDDATAAFRTALSNAQLPRCDAATGYFMQGDEAFSVRVRRATCVGTSEASDSPPPDFSGEPEPITDDVLRSLGMVDERGDDYWESRDFGTKVSLVWNEPYARLCVDVDDARKLWAIMEIILA